RLLIPLPPAARRPGVSDRRTAEPCRYPSATSLLDLHGMRYRVAQRYTRPRSSRGRTPPISDDCPPESRTATPAAALVLRSSGQPSLPSAVLQSTYNFPPPRDAESQARRSSASAQNTRRIGRRK